MESESIKTPARDSSDVSRIEVGGREFFIVGTAHISQASADIVRDVIQEERPDAVCVELDERRYHSLAEPDHWSNLDLKQILQKKQMSTLIIHVALTAYQRRLGMKLGVMPGTELLEAARVAEALDIPVELVDRDVRVTMRRAWRSTRWTQKMLLLASIFGGLFERGEMTEESLAELRQQDVLTQLLEEMGKSFPSLKKVLIDERDQYLAARILEAKGKKIVAVVGAGHVKGILDWLRRNPGERLEELDEIPPASDVLKWVGWGIPVAIIAALITIGIRKGAGVAGDNLVYWILANGIPSAAGAALALAHPLTIAAAFMAAPITSLTPVIGAGYVTAFVQAWLCPPRVHEVNAVAEDIVVAKRWWQNRLLRVFLAFLLPGFGSAIGTWVGGVEIAKNLF